MIKRKKIDKKVTLLFSGGPDSVIGFWYLMSLNYKQVKCLYIPLGHKYEKSEVKACKKLKRKWGIPIEIEDRFPLGKYEKRSATIYGRNLFLSIIAAQKSTNICLVVQKGEMEIPDRSKEFFKDSSRFLSYLFEDFVEVFTSFEDKTKVEMVRWFLLKNRNITREDKIEMLKDSVSCYSGKTKPCGECKACFRRWVAFSLNGIKEEYLVDPWKSEVAYQYIEGIRQGTYTGKRAEEILEALKKVK